MDRRDFIKNTFTAGAVAILGGSTFAAGGCRSAAARCKGSVRAAGSQVLNGIDNTNALKNALNNRKIGLVTNPSAINREGYFLADLLAAENRVEVFFAPVIHGLQ